MLLTTICFILGAPAQIVCKSIETGDLYSKVCCYDRYVLMGLLNASVSNQRVFLHLIVSLHGLNQQRASFCGTFNFIHMITCEDG